MAPENEPEAIRQQMDETRNALTDKIATLEAQVVETVEGASANVRETVETIKDAVQDTVQSVRDSVGDTVDSVRETFSIEKQIERRPWTVLALSAGIGFAAGYLLTPPARRTPRAAQLGGSYMSSPPAPSAFYESYEAPRPSPRSTAPTPSYAKTSGNGRTSEAHDEPTAPAPAPEPTASPAHGIFDNLASTFSGEISALKGLALGALGGLIRDVVVPQIPDAFKEKVHEVIDNVTSKLGGEPVKGPLFGEETHEVEGSSRPEPFSSRMGSHN